MAKKETFITDEQSQLEWEETFADDSFASAKKGAPINSKVLLRTISKYLPVPDESVA